MQISIEMPTYVSMFFS